MPRYEVSLDWFNGDDTEETDIEASSLEEAARKVWDEWSPTGWTSASVREPGRYLSIDLEAAEFSFWDSANPSTQ